MQHKKQFGVKELAHRLMESGSYQVECIDEGMMPDEIEVCLRPVIRAVAKADPDEAKLWCGKMMAADRVGFICDQELARVAIDVKSSPSYNAS